jgi:dUTPase
MKMINKSKNEIAEWICVENLKKTKRGQDGFGHKGK